MREIKFRVYDKENKNIYPVGGYFFEEEGLGDFDLAQTNKRYTLMQFTGLKDKNGKEIYEGDIAWVYYEPIEDGKLFSEPAVCKYDEGGFEWNTGKAVCTADQTCEIIGNIYENPELL